LRDLLRCFEFKQIKALGANQGIHWIVIMLSTFTHLEGFVPAGLTLLPVVTGKRSIDKCRIRKPEIRLRLQVTIAPIASGKIRALTKQSRRPFFMILDAISASSKIGQAIQEMSQ
jgi:hypothetical protein